MRKPQLFLVVLVFFGVSLGSLYAKESDNGLTVGLITSYIKESPKDPNLYYLRGVMFAEAGKNKKAVADLEKALELYPNYLEANLEIAKVEFRRANYSRALDFLETYLQRKDEDQEGQILKSRILIRTNEFKAAEKTLRSVISSDFQNPDAHLYLGEVYYSTEEFDAAYSEWKIAAKFGSLEAETHIKYCLQSVD